MILWHAQCPLQKNRPVDMTKWLTPLANKRVYYIYTSSTFYDLFILWVCVVVWRYSLLRLPEAFVAQRRH